MKVRELCEKLGIPLEEPVPFIAFRPYRKVDRISDALFVEVAKAYSIPIGYLYGIPERSAWNPHDPGDEDDVDRPQKHSFMLDRATLRRWASEGFRGVRTGGVVVFYPARRLPTMPDHDGGDEQPRLVNRLYEADL